MSFFWQKCGSRRTLWCWKVPSVLCISALATHSHTRSTNIPNTCFFTSATLIQHSKKHSQLTYSRCSYTLAHWKLNETSESAVRPTVAHMHIVVLNTGALVICTLAIMAFYMQRNYWLWLFVIMQAYHFAAIIVVTTIINQASSIGTRSHLSLSLHLLKPMVITITIGKCW